MLKQIWVALQLILVRAGTIEGQLRALTVKIDHMLALQGKLMADFVDVEALLQEVRDRVNAAIARIAALEAQLAQGGMTVEQEDQVKAEIVALRDSLPAPDQT